MRAKGIKVLQAPSTYIMATIAAFLLYYIDRHYRIDNLYIRSQEELLNLKNKMKSDPDDEEAPVDAYYVFVISLLVLSFVLALRKVLAKRRQEAIASGDIVQEDNLVIDDYHTHLRSYDTIANNACEKISNEEYEYQKDNLTRSEIHKLVQSDAYLKAMRSKGKEPENWNWQAYDRKQGILPPEVDKDQIDPNFELEREILKVDQSIQRKKEPSS